MHLNLNRRHLCAIIYRTSIFYKLQTLSKWRHAVTAISCFCHTLTHAFYARFSVYIRQKILYKHTFITLLRDRHSNIISSRRESLICHSIKYTLSPCLLHIFSARSLPPIIFHASLIA